MTPHRLLLTATPDSKKRGLHRHKKVPRSAARDGCATEEGEQETNQKKSKRITPSPPLPCPLPPPAVRVPDLNEFDRLVPSVTQLLLASSAAAVGQSPCQSPRLSEVKAPKLSDALAAEKSKQKVLGSHQPSLSFVQRCLLRSIVSSIEFPTARQHSSSVVQHSSEWRAGPLTNSLFRSCAGTI